MKDQGIPFDGFASVIEMLQKADGAFRAKILANIRKRDPHLAERLEKNLRFSDAKRGDSRASDTRASLERSQRLANTRNYGQ
jgi:hypothetical protein